jgi:predicted transcriptional regulator
MAFTKQDAIKLIQELPDDANLEDIVERFLFVQEVQTGLAQADRGETLSNAEVQQRFSKWLKD